MGGIYLIHSEGQLVEMKEQSYDSEDLLQELLAKYPSVLAGDQMDDTEPRRWLLVAREVALPSEDGGAGRWSIDHLFLDQDAIPTIVEVKRSTDPRIRREVVGQMLDYAANAVVYWPIETIRAQFEEQCRRQELEPEQVVSTFLGADADPEELWQKAKINLKAGRIRLVFVADEIPAELRRVVEFLNEQMDPAEVLAVEVKQYANQEGLKALVPRVIGQTAEAQRKKSRRATKKWDEPSFMQVLQSQRDTGEVDVAKKILEWAKTRMPRMWWGKGPIIGSVYPTLDHKGIDYSPFGIYTNGSINLPFQPLRKLPPFDDDSKRLELLHRLNEIPGVKLPDDAIGRYPNISLKMLKDETALKIFLEVLDWFVQEVKTV